MKKTHYNMNNLYKLTTDMYFGEKPLFTHMIGLRDETYHKHAFVEFFYVTSGNCQHKINDRLETLQIGDAYFLALSDKHGFISETGNEFLHRDFLIKENFFVKLCYNISPELYNDLNTEIYPKKFKLTQEQMNYIESLVSNMNESESQYEMYAKMLTFSLIGHLINKPHRQVQAQPSWVLQAMALFSAPHAFTQSMTDILRPFSFDNSYMCRIFKKCTGMTMTEYFNLQKLKYSRILIETTDFSIEKICELVGFNNKTHFYRCYNIAFHETPNAIRRGLLSKKTLTST